MEENVNEVLGVAENSAPETKVQEVDNSAENTLIFIAKLVLFCGIVASFICLITLTFIDTSGPYSSIPRIEFNPTGFATTITILLSSLISWSLLKVLANISLTLKDIRNKMK